MTGSDHAVEGAYDAFLDLLIQAFDDSLPPEDSTVRHSSCAPGQGAPPARSLPGAVSARPTDRPEPNSALAPNTGEGRRERVERLDPTSAGPGVPATTPSPARSLLPDEADDEHRGTSSGVVPHEGARRYGWREPGTPAVLLLPAPSGRTEWA